MSLSLNVGGTDRVIRLVLGIVLIALAYFGIFTGTAAIVAYVVGAIAIVTGLVNFCLLYLPFGINTRKSKS